MQRVIRPVVSIMLYMGILFSKPKSTIRLIVLDNNINYFKMFNISICIILSFPEASKHNRSKNKSQNRPYDIIAY